MEKKRIARKKLPFDNMDIKYPKNFYFKMNN